MPLITSSSGMMDSAILAGCWSHSRRKFYELHVAKSSKVATDTVERMARLWEIEERVRGQSPEARVAARQEISAAIVRDLFTLW
ncbi:transposase [Rhizobium laguerreae]|nr:transposase [Rhizobium laguerreae]